MPFQDALRHLNPSGHIERSTAVLNIAAHLRSIAEEQDELPLLELITDSLEDLLDGRQVPEDLRGKLHFILEQLQLAPLQPKQRRYSPDLLTRAMLWKIASSGLYRNILEEGVLSLPCMNHLEHLSKALSMATGLNQSTVSYLKARTKDLEENERLCMLLIDEVHVTQRPEFFNGRLTGLHHGEVTRSLLGLMLQSTCSAYKDMIALMPVKTLNSSILQTHFNQVLEAVTNIGIKVVGVSVDNFSANRKFYMDLCGGELKPSIRHPLLEEEEIFLLFDATHNLKNWFNNHLSRKTFSCPDFKGQKIGKPSMDHLHQLYELEKGSPTKVAYKLSKRVLEPSALERVNVQLANSYCHPSTIAGLRFHNKEEHPKWGETEAYLSLIRMMWNILNVKTPRKGIHHRDPTSMPITKNNRENLVHLADFAEWIKIFRDYPGPSWTKETITATHQTLTATIKLVEYLLDKKGFSYVLTGKFQSDPIERQFGRYRQSSGGNYFISTRQVLESEKLIRVKNIVKFNKLSMKAIQRVITPVTLPDVAELFIQELPTLKISDQIESYHDEGTVGYVAAYSGRSAAITLSCKECVKMLVESLDMPEVSFKMPDGSVVEEDIDQEAKDALIRQVNRGGLCSATDLCYLSCRIPWNFFVDVTANDSLRVKVFDCGNVVGCLLALLLEVGKRDSCPLLDQTCLDGHSFSPTFKKLCTTMFNVCMSNYTKELNDIVHSSKKRASNINPKAGPSARKSVKLQS